MRSPSRLILLLIFAFFGCAFTNPETALTTSETLEEPQVLEGIKSPSVTKDELFSYDADKKPDEPSNGAPKGLEGQDAAKEEELNVVKEVGGPFDGLLGLKEDKQSNSTKDSTLEALEGKPVEEAGMFDWHGK
ncbi:hypothetical protein TSMEX_009282 [Taenia solium]|eukprot:TsM_001139400 transcript=TsM_001139400 gene=TsM_001139400